MNVKCVSINGNEYDVCKGEENQPLASTRRGKENARKNVCLCTRYSIEGMFSIKKLDSLWIFKCPKLI